MSSYEEYVKKFMPSSVIPMVVETSARGERAFDVYSMLLRDRIVFLGTPIDDQVANAVVAQMLILQREDPDKPIRLYINSPGGVIYAGLAIYDTMQVISAPVHTYGIGLVASMATVLLSAGHPGSRYALPNALVHIHQPLGGAQGQAVDIEIEARRIIRERERLNEILAKHTGQPVERIIKDSDRNYYMEAPAAVEYGLIDEVLPAVSGKWDKVVAERANGNGKGK
jgi:ATP-dependent Clp protease protease subunit